MPMAERRYGEDEVREIFSLATTGDIRGHSLPSEPGSLTLEDLKRIGQEAGIEPARVAHAAQSLDARGQQSPLRRSFGLPVGMTRVVELPRAPTDREWEQLVSEFRTTFGAQGHATVSGGLREWSQGSLHISVEPTQHGEQLRLTTLKEDAIALNAASVLLAVFGALLSVVLAMTGKSEKSLGILIFFGGLALLAFGSNLLRLPRWARERERQMENLAASTVRLLSNPQRDIPDL